MRIVIKDIRPSIKECERCGVEKEKRLFRTVVQPIVNDKKTVTTKIKKLSRCCKVCEKEVAKANAILARRSIEDWQRVLNDSIQPGLVRQHVACIVWWDYHKSNQEWRKFLKENKCFNLSTSKKELAKALEQIGYPWASNRVGKGE